MHETVIGSSLAHASLLKCHSGSTGPVVYLCGLTGWAKSLCESRPGLCDFQANFANPVSLIAYN